MRISCLWRVPIVVIVKIAHDDASGDPRLPLWSSDPPAVTDSTWGEPCERASWVLTDESNGWSLIWTVKISGGCGRARHEETCEQKLGVGCATRGSEYDAALCTVLGWVEMVLRRR